MGWWNSPENSELMTGDAVLDMVRHFLRDFSREFQVHLSRRPTLEELEYSLNLGFKASVDEEVLDKFEEMQVKQVAIKTSKWKKTKSIARRHIFLPTR